MTKSNKIFLLIFLVGAMVALVEVGYLYTKRDKIFGAEAQKADQVSTSTEETFSRRLDGLAVLNPSETTSSVVAIMIDNHPDARPQSGLSQARVVYEVPVEGGITRFFAIFDVDDQVAKVGPVRSSRPYFLDWLSEYGNTSYWHSGGSKEALDLIKQFKIWDVNEFYFGPYFWRSDDREAPHNLYTSSDKWQKLFAGTPHEEQDWRGWLFDPNLSDNFTATDVDSLQIKYETNYLVGWMYDKEKQRYVRKQNDKIINDEAGSTVFADTVIVQVVESEVIDDEGRKKVTTIGKGDARVLRNGKMIRGFWQKDSRTNRTRFYDLAGREIPLQPGKIWIQVIPANTQMEVSS
jgi:hypothetical protein